MFLVWFRKENTIFYPANGFWENRKTLFIAEPRPDFNRCYEQWISEKHNWMLFIAVSLWFWSVAKYKRQIFKGFNCLYYWAVLNLLKVDCMWSCVPCMQATCLFCVPTIFVGYLDIMTRKSEHWCIWNWHEINMESAWFNKESTSNLYGISMQYKWK